MTTTSIDSRSLILDSVRQFNHRHVVPHVRAWDESQTIPRALFRTLGDLGLMGMLTPAEHGGSALDFDTYLAVVEELAQVDPSVALSVAAHHSLCSSHIRRFGSSSQQLQWLPALASGEALGAWALTEPQSGSDAQGMTTIAEKNESGWVLNGAKNFITHGASAEVLVVLARRAEQPKEISAFIVPRTANGLKKGRKEDKLGMRASETAEVLLENCQVGPEALIGKEGKGFQQALELLDAGRISIAALSVGIAQGAMDAACQYAKERKQFGKPIGQFQGISFMLANMYTRIQAARGLIKRAVLAFQNKKQLTLYASMAKYYASEAAVRIADNAVQILGGYGYTKDFPVEKFYRDAKLCTIGEGTSQIQQIVIARQILDQNQHTD